MLTHKGRTRTIKPNATVVLDAEPGDLSDILDVANQVATVDGAVNALEIAIISEIRDRCGRV